MRTRKLKLFLTTILALIFSNSNSQTDSLAAFDFNKKFTIEQQRYDLKVLKEVLQKVHPGIYWYTTKEKFEKKYESIYKNIKSEKTEYQFLLDILPLLDEIHCSHTYWQLSEDFEKYKTTYLKRFPINVKIIDKKAYVKDNFSSDTTIQAGEEIISINGLKIPKLLQTFSEFYWVDGISKNRQFSLVELYFKRLIEFYFNFPNNYQITLGKSQTKVKQVSSLSFEECDSKYYQKYPKISSTKISSKRISIIDSLKTAVLTYDDFMCDSTEFVQFTNESFKLIQDKKISNLIIDVRKNYGGAGEYGGYLISHFAKKEFNMYDHLEMSVHPQDTIFKYISHFYPPNFLKEVQNELDSGKIKKVKDVYVLEKSLYTGTAIQPFKPKQNNFNGKVYVLISNMSFSAASDFAATVFNTRAAILVGQTTGGGYKGNTSEAVVELKLPNSKIIMYIPVKKCLTSVSRACSSDGVVPDYFVKPDINDFKKGIDSEMTFTLDLIKRQESKQK
jgi:hypothetical protein